MMKLPNLLPLGSVAYARLRAACSRYRLPPGDLVDIEELEKSDRYFFLHQATQVGPIFKAKGPERFWVCIIGLERCRRFLQTHTKHLEGYMHDLKPMVPKGALRRMEGEDHRKYRKALNSGIQTKRLFQDEGPLNSIVLRELERFSTSEQASDDPPKSFRGALTAIATASLIKVFFGATKGMPLFDALMGGYHKLGPFGVIWNIGQTQEKAFCEIKDAVQDALKNDRDGEHGPFGNSIVGKLWAHDHFDDTLLGNLIYMVEMGRYDMAGLLRWLAKYAAGNSSFVERIASETAEEGNGAMSFTKAFVLETLRTDKSERLTRIVQRDLTFDRYLIPRGTYVRLCLWESHHMADLFEKPFDFDPDRFLGTQPGADRFAPFGMDHHRCPLADASIQLGTIFLRNLACNFRIESVGDGLPIRGAYHWEPAIDFGVQLTKREE